MTETTWRFHAVHCPEDINSLEVVSEDSPLDRLPDAHRLILPAGGQALPFV